MAINCEKCKYFNEDYLFDEETGDESPIFSCDKKHYDELHDNLCVCSYFKKYKIVRYVEKDTKCDKCECLQECVDEGKVIDCRTFGDTRSHYIGGLGARCEYV